MRLLVFALVVCASSAFAQSSPDPPEIQRVKEQVARVEKLVREGGLPKLRLDEAKELLSEAEDYAVLRRTLYGALKIEELTESLSTAMLESARRLVELQQKRCNRMSKMVEQGVVARTELTTLLEELDSRRKGMIEAESRVRLWGNLLDQARAEQVRQQEAEQLSAGAMAEAVDPGVGVLSSAKSRQLETDFERVFRKELPVSARGDTSFHRMMGFDHTGRLDVAVTPDSAEGQWLRLWLERSGVPYLAFRTAVKGQASAAHVHIGPPSSRLRTAD